MLAASPLIPWAGCASVTRQGMVPRPKVDGGLFLNPLTSPNFAYANTCPKRGILPCCCQRGGADWFIWCLHSTPQAATVRSLRPLLPLCRTGFPISIFLAAHPVLCLLHYCLFLCLQALLGWRPLRPPGVRNGPLRDYGRGHHTHNYTLWTPVTEH